MNLSYGCIIVWLEWSCLFSYSRHYFILFLALKQHMGEQRYKTYYDVKAAVKQGLKEQVFAFYGQDIKNLSYVTVSVSTITRITQKNILWTAHWCWIIHIKHSVDHIKTGVWFLARAEIFSPLHCIQTGSGGSFFRSKVTRVWSWLLTSI